MGTKNNPGTFDCYEHAKPDEPMFVLLGRDPIAAALVRTWAADCVFKGEIEKAREAYACADAMDAWTVKVGKRPRTPGEPYL